MRTELDGNELRELLFQFWPNVTGTALRIERLHSGRNADTWRVRSDDQAVVVRVADGEMYGARIVAALEALEDESFAPRLFGWRGMAGDRYLIAMEEIAGPTAEAADIRQRLGEFIDILRRLHGHSAFQRAAEAVGDYDVPDGASPPWVERTWRWLQENGRDETRVQRAAGWLERAQGPPSMKDVVNSVLVLGHGDLHRDNWRLPERGPVLLDWEDMGRFPLAYELASFINFGHLDPVEVAERYGAPESYVPAIEHVAAEGFLHLYLYWLRRDLDGSDQRLDDLAYAAAMCEHYF